MLKVIVALLEVGHYGLVSPSGTLQGTDTPWAKIRT